MIILLEGVLLILVQWIWGIVLLGLSWIHNVFFFLLGVFLFRSHKFWVSLSMLPTHHRAPLWDMPRVRPRVRPIHLRISWLHNQYTHDDRWLLWILVFFFIITYPETGRNMDLSSAWLTLQPLPSDSEFCKNLKESWHNQLIDQIRPLQPPV